jgi:preprotein translocase subunit SecB
MRADSAIDLAAAARISRRVDLREIRLVGISATCQTGPKQSGRLQPTYGHSCVPVKSEDGMLEVACSYHFKVHSAEKELAEASMTYHIFYKLVGDEPTEPSDIDHFARANGAYHSWPFVRETIFSLTSKMGFPPYTLPVLSFQARPKTAVTAANGTTKEPAAAATTQESNTT